MAAVRDAREAEKVVRDHYNGIMDPHPYGFDTHKQGDTWIVKFKLQGPMNTKECKWHIKAKDGRVTKK